MLDLTHIQGKLPTADQLESLEREMRKMPQVEMEVIHHFAPGIYTRQLFMPEGTILTGKIHRHEIMNVLVSGELKVTTNTGVELLTGPFIFNSKAGTKKAAVTMTDVIWLNIHPTELTDLDEIEKEFIAPSFEALEQESKVCLG